jgi:hypothetical protein
MTRPMRTRRSELSVPAAHSPEFEVLLDQLRARPFEADTKPVSELRDGFERFAAQFSFPPSVTIESVDAGGVPAEWARPSDSDDFDIVVELDSITTQLAQHLAP